MDLAHASEVAQLAGGGGVVALLIRLAVRIVGDRLFRDRGNDMERKLDELVAAVLVLRNEQKEGRRELAEAVERLPEQTVAAIKRAGKRNGKA